VLNDIITSFSGTISTEHVIYCYNIKKSGEENLQFMKSSGVTQRL